MKKNLVVFVATGFEDTELIAALDVFTRSGLNYDLVSPENFSTVRGKFNAIVETMPIKNFDENNYDGLFLPGGPGYEILLRSLQIKEVIKSYEKQGKILAAICAAPEVLKVAGVLEGVRITSYPGLAKTETNTGTEVEADKNIITGKDYFATIEFAKEVAKKFNK